LSKFLDNLTLSSPENYWEYRRTKAPAFFFSPSNVKEFIPYFQTWDKGNSAPVSLADDLLNGNLRYFSKLVKQVGFPPDWFRNPFTGIQVPHHMHWSQFGDFEHGDIKIIWEPSRFGFVYDLVRAYWRTGDEKYPEAFWRLVEDWYQNNSPQQGPNWKCGQEISFRLMAWCFGLYGFMNSPTTEPEHIAKLALMIAMSGERVEFNLNYALSQKNNHGISESLALWTIGLLFPEFGRARTWRQKGRKYLEELARNLIYDDGSFSQHSFNYHRLMLHDYLWALRLADLNEQPFSSELKERINRAAVLLYQVQDNRTGRLPNYGHNDGSLILRLNNCDYNDFRPIVQAIYYLCNETRCYDNGPWDEDLLWLFGQDAISAPVDNIDVRNVKADNGGYYTFRNDNSFVFCRCGSFRHRPGQADMTHVDLWWKGQNIALDPGTYSYNYNSPPLCNNSLSQTACHNVATVDGCDQMDKVGRFMWLPWIESQVVVERNTPVLYWEIEENSYQRLKSSVDHRRAIIGLGEDTWLILDRLTSSSQHLYRLHWLLGNFPHEWDESSGMIKLHTPSGTFFVYLRSILGSPEFSIESGSAQSSKGWSSPYYHYLEPALSVEAITKTKDEILVSAFSPQRLYIQHSLNFLSLAIVNRPPVHFKINQLPTHAIVDSIVCDGKEERIFLS